MIARRHKRQARPEGNRKARRLRTSRAISTPWPVPPVRSAAGRKIAQWFDLPVHHKPTRAPRLKLPPGLALPAPGQIMLITGPSGSGKSSLLRQLTRPARVARGDGARTGPGIVDVSRVRPRRVPCVDQFGDDIDRALDLLNRVGLGEAFTYLQLPRELSDGQRWRLRVAMSVAEAMKPEPPTPSVLLADEFCAVLDRVTAAVVARALRRMIDRLMPSGLPMSALVATSHDDLEHALQPDVVVRCDYGLTRVQHPRLRRR